MRILTAIALFDEVDLDLYRSNDISEWLARLGQADGYRLMYNRMIPIQEPIIRQTRQCKMDTSLHATHSQ